MCGSVLYGKVNKYDCTSFGGLSLLKVIGKLYGSVNKESYSEYTGSDL